MEKKEVNDYAVGGWDNANNCSNSLTHLLAQLRVAGVSDTKFVDPVSGEELAATEWIDNPDPDSLFGLSDEEFWALKKKSDKIKWLKQSIANWERTIVNKDSDTRYTSWTKTKDKRDCLGAWIGAMEAQKELLKELIKK